MIVLFDFVNLFIYPLIEDPFTPITGEISGAGNTSISILDKLIYLACVIALLISSYRLFFGDFKAGLGTFLIVLVMASILSAVAAFF